MTGAAKKGQGGSEDTNKKKETKKPLADPSKKPSTQQPKNQPEEGSLSQMVIRPSTPVAASSSMPLPHRAKGPIRESDTSPSKLPPFKFPPDSDAGTARLIEFSTVPIPPRAGAPDIPPQPQYDKGPSGKYKMNIVEGVYGSYSDRSNESSGNVSLDTNAYSEPIMDYMRERSEEFSAQIAKDEWVWVTLTRGGRYFMSRLLANDFLVKGQVWKAFMLHPGQGGTFGYGRVYLNERLQAVQIGDSEDRARKDKSLVKHLLYYGKDVGMIGTSRCVSCVGVYFELTGNRLFCAHINALHHAGRTKEPPMAPGSPDYWQMKEMIRRRMEAVATRDNWTKADYQEGTLKLVCPNKRIAGYAVVEAINEFLGTNEAVEDSPGFVFTPGFTAAPRGPRGKILLRTGTEGTARVYEGVPREINQVFCDDSHGRNAIQPFTYISGSGRPSGWLWISYGERNVSRYMPNQPIHEMRLPGIPNAGLPGLVSPK